MYSIAVIGGGAAGMMAAIYAKNDDTSVTIYDGNRMLGRKLRITGKGRCNVTNNCMPDEYLKHVIHGEKFLYGPIYKFKPEDTMNWFESRGVELKTERGRRVFPTTDNANTIANCMADEVINCGCIVKREIVRDIILEGDKVVGIIVNGEKIKYDAVIVATGGMSYPQTGSTGDGYKFAKKANINVTELKPSLVPIVTKEKTASLMGLSLKNVTLTVTDKNGKKIFSEMGEMLFTHFGLSGPLVLSASSHMTDEKISSFSMSINLKPALDENELDKRLISDFTKYSTKDFANSLGDLLPSKLIPYIIEKSMIPPHMKTGSITKEQRHNLLSLLHDLKFTPVAFRGIEEAIITSGGVDLSEIDPRTMMTKKVKGLYFAGEVLNCDAYTGGYNLQLAFATGKLAGESAIKYVETI